MIFRENAAATRLRLVFSLDAILRAFNLARVNSLFPHKPKGWQIGARLRRETLLAQQIITKDANFSRLLLGGECVRHADSRGAASAHT